MASTANDEHSSGSEALRALPRFYRGAVADSKARLRNTTLLSRRKNSSIARRIQWLMILWGVTVYLLALLGFVLASHWVIQTNLQRQAALWVEELKQLSGPLYNAYDLSQFERMRKKIEGISEIVYLQFYQADGKTVLASYIRPEARIHGRPSLSLAAINTADAEDYRAITQLTFIEFNDFTRAVAPITVNHVVDNGADLSAERVLGYIDMGIDISEYTNEITHYAIGGSIIISIMFLFAAVVGRWWVKRALGSLMSLREPLARLAEGDTNISVGRYQDEEIDAISKALNVTIAAIRQRDDELRQMANCDDLTGLVNKRAFNQILTLECERVKLERDSSCLIYIDLDQFKCINDSLGHAAGDRLLVQVARMLQERMRRGDVVSRLGGDEFAVLVKSVNRDNAVDIAHSLVKAMHDFVFVDGDKTFSIYCSMGLAMIDSDHRGAEAAFASADMACYTAKARGRNQFCVYEAAAGDREKMDFGWSQRINAAISDDSFVIHFQPIFAIDGDTPYCYEVLVRMSSEEQGLVPPNLFLPVAERFGLMTEIDYCVLRQSIRLLREQNAADNRLTLCVNLSAQTLILPDFVATVCGLIEHSGVTGEQIIFEIAERTAVSYLALARQRIVELNQFGFRFLIDDFGTGFASIAYLKNLPVTFVKIDGQLVEHMVDGEVDYAIVKSMIDIAKACNKTVIAEFVGNRQVIDALTTLGADFIQGHYLGMPSRDLLALDGTWRAEGVSERAADNG